MCETRFTRASRDTRLDHASASPSLASAKSVTHSDAPAPNSAAGDWLVVTPTEGAPAATAAAIPVGESSNATHRAGSVAPSSRMPSR